MSLAILARKSQSAGSSKTSAPSMTASSGLHIGEPNTAFEQEADRVADQAMAGAPGKFGWSLSKIGTLQGKSGTLRSVIGNDSPAPPIVGEVLRAPGQPLDRSTRAFMEQRFSHDFSKVRVHTDSQATASAGAVDARAFTSGNDIVFGAGQYAPSTSSGRSLLAHELTHVLQQDASANAVVQRQPRPSSADDAKEFIRSSVEFLETSAETYRVDLLSKGAKFDEANFPRQLSRWKATLEKSQGIIDATLGKDATLTQGLRSAYQKLVSAAVAFAANRLNATSRVVYEKYRELIAEWALPQAVPETSPDELSAALPKAERQKLTVITSAVSFSVDDLFSTKTAKTTIPLPSGVTVSFASGVAARIQDGLKNVAGTIVPTPLILNSMMTLALDLESYGGDYGSYRFTYVEHKPKRGKPKQEILIERLGAIGVEGLTKSQATAAQKKFDAHGFKRGSGWSDPQFDNLRAAIVQIPDSILSPVDGITFTRDRVNTKDPKVAGNYNPDTHTITIFDLAFMESTTRFGAPGVGTSSDTVRAITHEVGHAVDLLPLRRAWASLEQKQQALKTAFAQFEDPPGSGNFSFPSTEQGKFNKLNADITAAEQALTKARSESGERYQKNVSGTFEMGEGGVAAGSIEFRKAAEQDGGTRITAYSKKEWQEYYAESFSLFITDPATLRRLRPKVYAFLDKKHPK